MQVKIGGVQKFSLLDFPEKISTIIFTSGCNFNCGYCHNPELFDNYSEWNEDKVISFLKTRQNKLDGIVITGGEPTIHKNLKKFIQKIKDLNFLVKLDTNGTNPGMLEDLIKSKLVDYIAMDIKAPLDKYNFITRTNVNIDNIKKSIDILLQNNVPYEFRTTALKSQLTLNDCRKIGELINGAEQYYIQKFIPTKILDENLLPDKGYSKEEIDIIINLLRKYIRCVTTRNI